MPNIVGLSYETAKKRLEEAGFFMHAVGTSTFTATPPRRRARAWPPESPRPSAPSWTSSLPPSQRDGYAGIN